jgi:cell wall-associated NlpC family hydrolase
MFQYPITTKPIESKSTFAAVTGSSAVDTNYDVAFHGTDFFRSLVSTASENIGRYRAGGTTKAGFDCSD